MYLHRLKPGTRVWAGNNNKAKKSIPGWRPGRRGLVRGLVVVCPYRKDVMVKVRWADDGTVQLVCRSFLTEKPPGGPK